MRKLLFLSLIALLVPILLPNVGAAQETYSMTLVPANVATLDLGRAQQNDDVCKNLNLAVGCTQAQACTAANVTGGASCTSNDAIAANVRIFPNSLAGRESFAKEKGVKANLDNYAAEQVRRDKAKAAVFCATANQTQKDAVCTAYGLSAGCMICQ